MNAESTMSALAARFVDEVEDQPDSVAVIAQDASLTFQELGREARAFQEQILRAAPRAVGLYSPPSAALVSAAWGALCSGTPYVPLSPTYPDERLRFMAVDSSLDVVFAPEAHRETIASVLSGLDIQIIGVPGEPGDGPVVNLAKPESIAYILYTSGSTGTPKGVKISHRALAHQVSWLERALGVGRGARVVHKTPISFDAAQWELLATADGATTVAASPDAYRDPEDLLATIAKHGVTHLQAVPTLLQALHEDDALGACSSLRVVTSGGEVLSRRLANSLQEALPNAAVVNLYGPTETTINASHHVHSREDRTNAAEPAVAIGNPVPGMDFHLLDAHGRAVESGIGELAIAGPQLAEEYHGLPEETQRRFITLPTPGGTVRAYRTGDLVEQVGGTYFFRGRTDSQVKIRGHRIELGEVRAALTNHDWVRHAEVLPTHDAEGSTNGMVGFVELNPHEAALMDQGAHGAHHQSKSSHTQVKAQVAGLGIRDEDSESVSIPLSHEWTEKLRELAFARKTYRDFRSTTSDLERLAALRDLVKTPLEWEAEGHAAWSLTGLGAVLGSLTQFTSVDRLLPKRAYASPGALYGVQVYASVAGVEGVVDGVYYLNPATSTLQKTVVRPADEPDQQGIRLVLVGQRSVISSVYSTNVDEVLLFEAGHLLGAVDLVAPSAGYRLGVQSITDHRWEGLIAPGEEEDRFVIGDWPLVPASERATDPLDGVEVRIELYRGGAERNGVYEWGQHGPGRTNENPLVRRKDVIAINQRVYNEASFGLILTADASEPSYIALGRTLQRAQQNGLGIGLMSSGYSSFSGHDLPSARRIRDFCAVAEQSSYFALGGPVTAGQIAHTGMDEDLIHAQGPAEIIGTDIAIMLPHYMVPDRIVVLDELPRTPNGKIDAIALREFDSTERVDAETLPHVAPRTVQEHQVAKLWQEVLGTEDAISTNASFFGLGGNSISAVRLVRSIRKTMGVALPIQAVFEQDTVAKQAEAIAQGGLGELSRIVSLAGSGTGAVYMWPGLGGYPMNLKQLAERLASDSVQCYGVQAHGLNEGEEIDESVQAMAARDIAQIKKSHTGGPFTLIGYSFGARVAFEAAYQLEREGHDVHDVVLIAPGSPSVEDAAVRAEGEGLYRDPRFVRVLYSVFFARTDGADADRVVEESHDRASFLTSIKDSLPLDADFATRITELVERTYSFEYTFTELEQRSISAPLTIIRATGDDYSFLDSLGDLPGHDEVDLEADHYEVLRSPNVEKTSECVRAALTRHPLLEEKRKVPNMLHLAVLSYPSEWSEPKRKELYESLASLISSSFGISDLSITISNEKTETISSPPKADMTGRPEPELAGTSGGIH